MINNYLFIQCLVLFLVLISSIFNVDARSLNITKNIQITGVGANARDASISLIQGGGVPFLYVVYSTGYAYYSLDHIVNSTVGIVPMDGSESSGSVDFYRIVKYNTDDSFTFLTGKNGVYFCGPSIPSYPNIPFSEPGTTFDKMLTASTPGPNIFTLGLPYTLIQSNPILFYGTKTYTTNVPTDLTCDLSISSCFLVGSNFVDIYKVSSSFGLLTISTRTLSPYDKRINGIQNKAKNMFYYIAIGVGSFSLEGYDLDFFMRFKKDFYISTYGNFVKMAFDKSQGQLFIGTTTQIISLDWMGENLYSIETKVASNAVSMDVWSQTSIKNTGDLFITKSDNGVVVIKYDSYCPQNCNNNGYCGYSVCTCPNGGNSICNYEITGLSSRLLQDSLLVTLSGKFFEPPPSTIDIFVGSTLVPSVYVISIGYNSIKFNFDSYSESTLISFTTGGQNLTYQPNSFYPNANFNSVVQIDNILYVHGEFGSFYSIKATITSENNYESTLEISNSTTAFFTVPDLISNQLQVSFLSNDQPTSKTINLSPYFNSTLTSSDRGGDLNFVCNYYGSIPKAYLDGRIEVSVQHIEDNKYKVQIPAGVYTNITLGNGFYNISVPLEYKSLSITSVVQTDVQKLTITATDFGIDQDDVSITLSGEQLEIIDFDYTNGKIDVSLTDESIKGDLVIQARQIESISINLKPNITSITPINPSYNGDTITITGLYLSTNVEFKNKNSNSSLSCSELTSTSIHCSIPKGSDIFTIKSISEHPHQGGESLTSNVFISNYEEEPIDSSGSNETSHATSSSHESSLGSTTTTTTTTTSTAPSVEEVPEPNSAKYLQSQSVLVFLLIILLLL
ncbi:hypothetical protein CYY_000153 [Polysphondylium violaceum]|uniref:IPT/TIG domain-containing protein n=1 Tax=Polysphondylium violaceum TaxID=133409 RepID=A0A8J4Q091_9MYCE|nr:hypothetical protein CYY_000153 [Polysphondylium violaceum]